MSDSSYFDRRAATYDQDELHHRVVSLLLDAVDIRPGSSILDIATGTGLLALAAAQRVGPDGNVTGIDVSPGMLAEARRKAEAAALRNIGFLQADAEQLAFPPDSFDYIFCASAIVFMSDVSAALRRWSDFLKPNGVVAFDAPAKPFGLPERIAATAAAHGVRLAYAEVADTAGQCRELLEGAGFDVMDVRTERAGDGPIALAEAIAFWDGRLDHPAWQAVKRAPPARRAVMRSDYVDSVTLAAIDGRVPNNTVLNFVVGRKAAAVRA
jgi:ubiquinone/menaquinone biosynthesis C-methylase UbiE